MAHAKPAPPDAVCTALSAREVARAEEQIRRRFDTSLVTPHKLVVDFGCGVAFPTVDEVVFEDGSGHGGTLRLVRFKRSGASFTVRMIASSHYYQPSVTLSAGTIPAARLDALVARVRVQMLARPHLIELSQDDGIDGVMGGSFSSNDFHLRISLTDAAGRKTDRTFTGYESSESQEERLPMELASEPLLAMIVGLPMTPVAITDEDRRFFSERFGITMQGAPAWWVKDRFIALDATFGTMSTIPALLRAAEEPSGGGSEVRRELVFDAVRAITGWDPRIPDSGATRTPDEAARAMSVECSTEPSTPAP